MAYLNISNFEFGMDRRRPQDSGVPGTLWILENGVISRGGDAIRAKKFFTEYTLPSGTFGMALVKGQPYVFGSGTDPGVPVGVTFQQIAAPDTPDLTGILDAKTFDGKLYVVAEYDDGNIYHFYDGQRVSDWDDIADNNSGYDAVAEALAQKIEAGGIVRTRVSGNVILMTAVEPGTPFTLDTDTDDVDTDSSAPTAVDAAVTANVVEVEETLAEGSVEILTGSFSSTNANRIEDVTVNGVSLLLAPVPWVSSNNATANALAIAINNNTATSGYTAEASGAVVTITAVPGTGATPNTYVVSSVVFGDLTTTDTNMAGGVTYVAPVAQVSKVTISGSVFDATDMWEIEIDSDTYRTTGRAAGMGTAIFPFKSRMWAVARSSLRYSALNDAEEWGQAGMSPDASIDGGFITVSSDTEGAQQLVGLCKYNGMLAVFSRETISLYEISTDAEENSFFDSLENTGTLAARSIIPFGNTDVYYLDNTGIRSIRARQTTDSPFVSDVGSALDPFVQEIMAATDADTLSRAVASIEPVDGRYMLAIGNKVVVLSYFPASKITAWSFFSPGYTITDFSRYGRDLFARAGDTIRVYGGFSGEVYPDDDELPMTLETPFTSANDPAGRKGLTGFDAAVENDWLVKILPDPTDTTKEIVMGTLRETNYHKPDAKLPGQTTHAALRMTCNKGGYARVSSIALHYDDQDTG